MLKALYRPSKEEPLNLYKSYHLHEGQNVALAIIKGNAMVVSDGSYKDYKGASASIIELDDAN